MKLIRPAIIALILLITLTGVMAATTHCWRQDISRTVDPTVTFTGSFTNTLNGFDYVATIGSSITFTGFGSFVYYCDDGATGSAKNYVDVYDATTGKILATNSASGSGPISGGSVYCQYGENVCYIKDGKRYPSTGTCNPGALRIGAGNLDSITIQIDENMVGHHRIQLRLGAISPAGVDKYSPLIMPVVQKEVNLFVGMPNLIVSGQQKLKHTNYFDKEGNSQETALFTLLNKSPFAVKVKSYRMNCLSSEAKPVNCALETRDENLLYKDFTIAPNSVLVIPGTITLSKNNLPQNFFTTFDVNYSISQFAVCDPILGSSQCKSTTAQMEFQVGLLSKQEFQIEAVNETEQKYCVGFDGVVGKTGAEYVPHINIAFDGNITMNECSPEEAITGAENQTWVYCSQKEFLLQLAHHIGKMVENYKQIEQLEADRNYNAANALRLQTDSLGSFQSYITRQELTPENSLEAIQSAVEQTGVLDKLILPAGFGSSPQDKAERLENFATMLNFKKISSSTNMEVAGVDFEPGLYNIRIDINKDNSTDVFGWQLFSSNSNTANPALRMVIRLVKDEARQPTFDWFFYHSSDPQGELTTVNNSNQESAYVTNVSSRGIVLQYVDNPAPGEQQTRFNKTLAVPMIVKLSDFNHSRTALNAFGVTGYPQGVESFSIWTGFASSQGNGCETIATQTASGSRTLPYREPDNTQTRPNYVQGGVGYAFSDATNVALDSNMYLETVLYIPTTSQALNLYTPFNVNTTQGLCEGTKTANCNLIINPQNLTGSTYGNYKVGSVTEAFEKIRDGNVCVLKDSAFGKTTWRLFWNQEVVLEALRNVKAGIRDAKICTARELISS